MKLGKRGVSGKYIRFKKNVIFVVTPYQPSKDRQKFLGDFRNDNISSKRKTLSETEASEFAEERG